jgi:hypothetical protein
MSGSGVAAGEAIPLPTITLRGAAWQGGPGWCTQTANTFQIGILAAFTAVLFFLVPELAAVGANFQIIIYDLIPASAAVL